MTAIEEAAPKKKTAKKGLSTIEKMEATALLDGPHNVVDLADAKPKPAPKLKPKPRAGTADFDWKTEYPDDDEVYVYTSPAGLTIGLTKLGPRRKPKPGLLRRLHREGGMSVMWYFLELASSPASLRLQEELDEDEYTAMLRGWADFAGIELSE